MRQAAIRVAQDQWIGDLLLAFLQGKRQHAGTGDVGQRVPFHQVALPVVQRAKGDIVKHIVWRDDHQVGLDMGFKRGDE